MSRQGTPGARARSVLDTRLAASPRTSRLRTTASMVLRSARRGAASSPAAYSITRAQASTMSSTYAASSRDTSSLSLDSCAQAWLERRAGHQIDLHPEAVFEKQLQAHVPIERRASDEVDEHIEIARIRCFTTRNRAEDREVANTKARTRLWHQLDKSSEGEGTVHAVHHTAFAVELL